MKNFTDTRNFLSDVEELLWIRAVLCGLDAAMRCALFLRLLFGVFADIKEWLRAGPHLLGFFAICSSFCQFLRLRGRFPWVGGGVLWSPRCHVSLGCLSKRAGPRHLAINRHCHNVGFAFAVCVCVFGFGDGFLYVVFSLRSA